MAFRIIKGAGVSQEIPKAMGIPIFLAPRFLPDFVPS